MNDILKSLNLNEGAVLTLEKLQERMEFEAFAPAQGQTGGAHGMICIIYVDDVSFDCPEFGACLCDCPMVSYEPCQPNKA